MARRRAARPRPAAGSPIARESTTVKRDAVLQALAEARHADPFSVLGPHVEPDGVVIRTIIPTAERVTITRNGFAGST